MRLSSAQVLVTVIGLAVIAGACERPPAPQPDVVTSVSARPPASPQPSSSTLPTKASTSLPWERHAREARGNAARGKELVAQFQCQRCHDDSGAPAIANDRHCVHCHQDVMRDRFRHKPDNARWKKNVAHLTAVPTLKSMGQRYRFGWLMHYLLEPHDLRPALIPTMPRLALDRDQARDIATYLTQSNETATAAAPEENGDAIAEIDITVGRQQIEAKGCGSCHRFTGVAALTGMNPPAPGERETRAAVLLAPDLRYTRDRFRPEKLVAWLRDPNAIKPGTLMPQTPMSLDEARAIAAYLLHAPLSSPPTIEIPRPLPPLQRPVRFAEVAKKILNVTCRHCHGDPDVALGDGGPGNSGGFGFPARGIDLTSYGDVAAGYIDDQGERHSLFQLTESGQPRLVAALWARHAEQAGKPVPGIRGMPLGLPAIAPEDIQILESWVAQGRPR